MSGKSARENRRQALAAARKAEAKRKRRRRLAAWTAAAVVLVGAGTGIGFAVSGGGSAAASGHYAALTTLGRLTAAPAPGPMGPERVPIPSVPVLASPSAATAGQPIDGISCQASEQTLFHIHTHLTIFVNGKQQQVPAGIGIPHAVAQQTSAGPFIDSGSCFYWLHTHAADGIIHIESPVHRSYTLGDFFDEWHQPLSATQVGPAQGKVTTIINGQVWKGNPRYAPLGSHENLQLEVGAPLVTPESINWSITGL
ncbi:MAG: hypothetical protein JO016_05780 [Actinobacteria bacterium]|nr:hypothetical protein [Actinomycetota bacterium]